MFCAHYVCMHEKPCFHYLHRVILYLTNSEWYQWSFFLTFQFFFISVSLQKTDIRSIRPYIICQDCWFEEALHKLWKCFNPGKSIPDTGHLLVELLFPLISSLLFWMRNWTQLSTITQGFIIRYSRQEVKYLVVYHRMWPEQFAWELIYTPHHDQVTDRDEI